METTESDIGYPEEQPPEVDDTPAEGTPHVILTGKVVCGSVDIRGQRKSFLGRRFERH